MKIVFAILIIILGLCVGALFIYSGRLIYESGDDLTYLRSQGGT
jgi:hypothetical protein